MKFKKKLWITAFTIGGLCSLGLSYDGVHVSAPSKGTQSLAKGMIEDYVEKVAINLLVKKSGEVLQRAITQQNLQMLPQLVYYSAQKISSECFNQPDLQKMIRNAYDHGVEVATEQRELQASSAMIQRKVSDVVDAEISQMVFDPYYRLIVEQVIQQAMVQQRTIIMQKTVEKEIQKLILQQQLMEKSLQHQYKQTIQGIY